MSCAWSTSGFVVLLLVPRDIAKTYKRLAQNGDAVLPLGRGRGCNVEIAPVELRGELELITARGGG